MLAQTFSTYQYTFKCENSTNKVVVTPIQKLFIEKGGKNDIMSTLRLFLRLHGEKIEKFSELEYWNA